MLKPEKTDNYAAKSAILKLGLSSKKPMIWSIDIHTAPSRPVYDMHVGVEFSVLLKGKIRRWIKGYNKVLNPGDIWLSGAFEPHGFQVLEAPVNFFCVIILPFMLASVSLHDKVNYLAPFYVPPEKRPQALPEPLKKKFKAIAREVGSLEVTDKFAFEEMLLQVKVMLLQILRNWEIPRKKLKEVYQVERIMPALDLVEKNPTERISADTAATVCSMSKTLFIKRFKPIMGISFYEYEKRFKLALVAKDILQTDLKLEYLARHYGFTDGSHLHKVFKKYYGVSPHDYQLSARRP